jgi:hypothetical protein
MLMSHQELAARENKILEMLGSRGEMWIGDICTSLGLQFPADLEKVRGTLNRLVRDAKVSKRMDTNHQTRRACYSLTNPKAAWKEPGDFSPTRSVSTGATDQIGGLAPSPSDTPVSSNQSGET